MPKGEDKLMVYNVTSSGLNNALWYIKFDLPMIQTTLRVTEEGTYMADRDIGKMFQKFMLRKEFRLYCGVGISNTNT